MQFGVQNPQDLVKEKYSLHSETFPTPAGCMNNCFLVGDYQDDCPRVDGVEIPKENFDTRYEIELDLSVCTPMAATGIICEYIL